MRLLFYKIKTFCESIDKITNVKVYLGRACGARIGVRVDGDRVELSGRASTLLAGELLV